MADPSYDHFRPSDAEPYLGFLRRCFGKSRAWAVAYRDAIGPANLRSIRQADEAVGHVSHLPMGQYHGGQRVPCLGIGYLGIEPAWRGHGLARFTLERMLAAASADGLALALLYASARPVYRQLGFELAGFELVYEAETAALPGALRGAETDAGWQPLGSADQATLMALYRARAEAGAGLIDRLPCHWHKVLRPHDGEVDGWLLRRAGEPVGHVLLRTDRGPVLELTDWSALDGAAVRDLLAFLAGHRAVFSHVRWHGAPEDPLLFQLPDKGWRFALQEEWMLRVVDLAAALTARGYPHTLAAELGLTVADPVLAANSGSFRLTVAAGRGRVERLDARPARGLRLEVTALGPLFSGHRSASFLATAGRLAGDPDSLTTADLIFAGPKPWIAEHF